MKLAVREWGQGPRTAVVVHGATGTADSMAPLASCLVELGYRVLGPDLRGHGASPRGGPYTLQALADDLVESLPAGADLITAHSLGGKVLPWAIPGLRPRRALYLDPAWVAPPYPPGTMALAKEDGSPMNLADARRMHPGAHEGDLQAAVDRYLTTDWRMFHDPLLQIRRTTVPPIPAEAPSLVVTADPSELVTPILARALRIGGYVVRPQPGAGHGLFHEDMEGFLAVVGDWVYPQR
jgi:pimeloyl-ACP methyl ester carboxylesterase